MQTYPVEEFNSIQYLKIPVFYTRVGQDVLYAVVNLPEE